MIDKNEQLALARLIMKTQGLLFRLRMRNASSARKLSTSPALTPQQCHLMMTVHEQKSVTVSQLTQLLHVNAPSVSIMVERLVELGLLTREEDPQDRRKVIVQLSQDHREQIEEIEQQYLQIVLDLMEKIGTNNTRMWGTVCQSIQETLDDMH